MTMLQQPRLPTMDDEPLYCIQQPNPHEEGGRRLLIAMSVLSTNPDYLAVLRWLGAEFEAASRKCIGYSGDALPRAQGAAQILSDILKIQIMASDVLRAASSSASSSAATSQQRRP